MKKHVIAQMETLREVLGPEGFLVNYEPQGRHPRFLLTAPNGRTWTKVLPCSPRLSDDAYARRLATWDARRILGEYRGDA